MSTELQKIGSSDLMITDKSLLPMVADKDENLVPAFAPTLNKEQRDIVLACAQGAKLCKVERAEAMSQVKDIVVDTLLDLGIQLNDDSTEEYARLVLMVSKDILHDFRNLTSEEVRVALRNGARGKYGHVKVGQNFGVNSVNFYNWMLKYVEEERGKARIKQRKYLEELNAPKPPTEAERRISVIRSILHQFRVYQQGKEVYLVKLGVVNDLISLQRLRIFNPNEKAKKKAMQDAEEKMKMAATLNLTDPSYRNQKNNLLDIVKGLFGSDAKTEQRNLAATILIKQFFEKNTKKKSDPEQEYFNLQKEFFNALLKWRKDKNGSNWLERIQQRIK